MWGSELASDCRQECLLISFLDDLGNPRCWWRAWQLTSRWKVKTALSNQLLRVHDTTHPDVWKYLVFGGSFSPLSSYLRKIYLTVGYLSTTGDIAPDIWLAGRWWAVKEGLTFVSMGEALDNWQFSAANSWGSSLGLHTQDLSVGKALQSDVTSMQTVLMT